MKNKPNDDIFSKYINNLTTKEENDIIEQWYNQYLLSHDSTEELDWSKLSTTLQKENRSIYRSIYNFSKGNFIKLAACLTVIFLFSFWLFFIREKNSESFLEQVYPNTANGYVELNGKRVLVLPGDTAIVLNDNYLKSGILLGNNASSNLDSIVTVKAPIGQNLKVQLIDGSTINLNSESEIHLPLDFSNNKRFVHLEGEASFKITKQAVDNPLFKVEFGNHHIEVLGTEFNIKSRKSASDVKVSMLSGKIRLRNNSENIILIKGEDYTYDKKSNTYRVDQTFEADKVLAWQKNDFNFERTNLVEMCDLLSQWYDVEIVLGDNIDPKETYTGIISRNKNLSQVLTILNINNQYTFKVNNDERRITIDK